MEIQGRLKIDVYKLIDDQKVWIDGFDDGNLITLSGKQIMTYLLSGEPGNHALKKVACGEGGSNPLTSNTDLTNKYIKSIDSYTYLADNVVQFTISFGTGDANGLNIAEFGLFSEDEQLFSRKIRTPFIPKDSSIIIDGYWTIYIFECKNVSFVVQPTIEMVTNSTIYRRWTGGLLSSTSDIVFNSTSDIGNEDGPFVVQPTIEMVTNSTIDRWTADDPFDGDDGDPPDTEKWVYSTNFGIYPGPPGTFTAEDIATIESNKLNYNRDATPTGRYYSTYRSTWNFVAETDFEIQIDFDFQTESGGNQSSGPTIQFGFWYTSPAYGAQIQAGSSPWFGNKFRPRTSYYLAGFSNESFGTVPYSSKLKIKYENIHPTEIGRSEVTYWWWDSVAEQWAYDGDTDGYAIPGDRMIHGAHVYYTFSVWDGVNVCNLKNFKVISGEIER